MSCLQSILIGFGDRKLVLAKHDWLLSLSLSKSLLLEQIAGVLAEFLEYLEFGPVQQFMVLLSEDMHKAHLPNGLLCFKTP